MYQSLQISQVVKIQQQSKSKIFTETKYVMLQNKDAILDELRATFKADILDIHEFHLWCLVPPTTFATLHVIFRDEAVS